jgi:filamentous hemagglutinin family protein
MEQTLLKVIGISLSLIGGIMMVIGFRAQYRIWNPMGMKSASKAEENTGQAVAKTA